jgi:hypothetical protein
MTTAGMDFFEAEKLVRENAEGKKRQPIFVQQQFAAHFDGRVSRRRMNLKHC